MSQPLKEGDKFGRLTFVTRLYAKGSAVYCRWVCDCGNSMVSTADNVRRGRTKSCGCLRREVSSLKDRTHGMSSSPIYAVWNSILGRCLRKGDSNYKNYGARGITVCDRWLKFENFIADMGIPEAGLSIERIDNDGNYEPGNCRWATKHEQDRNKRNTRLFEFNGRALMLSEWADVVGIKTDTLSSRVRLYNWSIERALTTPVK